MCWEHQWLNLQVYQSAPFVTQIILVIAVENENDCNQVANCMIVCANVKQR
jgi:hypothetical protein